MVKIDKTDEKWLKNQKNRESDPIWGNKRLPLFRTGCACRIANQKMVPWRPSGLVALSLETSACSQMSLWDNTHPHKLDKREQYKKNSKRNQTKSTFLFFLLYHFVGLCGWCSERQGSGVSIVGVLLRSSLNTRLQLTWGKDAWSDQCQLHHERFYAETSG